MRFTNILHLQASVAAAWASLIAPSSDLSKRSTQCDCYLTNGSVPMYFYNHTFFDFRSLPQYASVPKAAQEFNENAKALVANDYFKSDNWTSSWSLQRWNNSRRADSNPSNKKTLMTNSFSNVYIQKNDDQNAASETFLTMRTKRLEKFQTSAEIESQEKYQFITVRMLARTLGSPGAVTALFTYLEGDSLANVQEADIEILTRGPRNRISYTNQPSYTDDGDTIPKATVNATIPGGREWTEWLVHRLDWTPGASVWYVDGAEAARIEFQTPRDPSQIILNAWSDGGKWSGNMTANDEAFMQVQWIEMLYNPTSDSDGKIGRDDSGKCKLLCSIDEAITVSEAVPIEHPKSRASHLGLSWVASMMALGVSAVALLA